MDTTLFALLAGRAGGQTLIGGTAASENLTLQSTAHATKGKIVFGTSAYDEANNRLGIGTTSPATLFHLSLSSTSYIQSTGGVTTFRKDSATNLLVLENRLTSHLSDTGVKLGFNLAHSSSDSAIAAAIIGILHEQTWTSTASTQDAYFVLELAQNGTSSEKFRVASDGKGILQGGMVIGQSALSTSATSGFLYLPTCAGTPSGVPATETGTVATVYDTTNQRLYVFSSSWKSVAFT